MLKPFYGQFSVELLDKLRILSLCYWVISCDQKTLNILTSVYPNLGVKNINVVRSFPVQFLHWFKNKLVKYYFPEHYRQTSAFKSFFLNNLLF
jgi:hypothetical protein